MPWHGHSNSVTQTEALKNLLHLGAMFFYAIIPAFIAYSHAYTLFFVFISVRDIYIYFFVPYLF